MRLGRILFAHSEQAALMRPAREGAWIFDRGLQEVALRSEQLGCLQLVRVARNGNAASPLPGAALSWRAISEARFIPL
jgi:hypothetical protein